jgi:hypothetical protein
MGVTAAMMVAVAVLDPPQNRTLFQDLPTLALTSDGYTKVHFLMVALTWKTER